MSTEATKEQRIQGGEGGTVRVRIAVAVDDGGRWSAAGWPVDNPTEKDWRTMQVIASDTLEPGGAEAFHWIEADVPVPLAQTIEGDTSPGTPPESAVDHPSTDTTED